MDKQMPVSLDLIDPNPYQPRQAEDPAVVAEIAESIQRHGLMQVPTARAAEGGRYQLAFGHTRLAAVRLNGEPRMPLIIRDLSDLQMFELGVAENIKRRDLNPIEQARAMHRYMQEFGKNSVETGEFFNVSPEKVRNTIRLLNLPEKIQNSVAEGEITQNGARRLLTIQRVAPEKIEHVAKDLKGSVDPENVISSALRDTGNAVEMWPNWKTREEPHAGEHLWSLRLPAEQFPHKYLPTLRAAEAAKALGIEFTADSRRDLEAWIGAFLEIHPKLGGGHWFNKHGSHRIDGDVAEFLIAQGEPPEQIERIAHLLNPPACNVCPFYAKVNGTHFCTFKACHSRKVRAWQENELQKTSRKLKIAIYDPAADGKESVVLEKYKEAHMKLVQASHADLRLKKGSTWNPFDGVPHGLVIIAVGAAVKKLQEKEKSNGSGRSQDNESYYAEQRRLRIVREARREAMNTFLWNIATPAFQVLLSEVSSLEFLNRLTDRVVAGVPAEEPDRKTRKAERLDFYRRAILFELLDDVGMWDISQKTKPVAALARHLQGVATSWGVKLPRNWMDMAAEADKGIKILPEAEIGKA